MPMNRAMRVKGEGGEGLSLIHIFFIFPNQQTETDESEQCVENQQLVAELITSEPGFGIFLQNEACLLYTSRCV